MKAFLVFALLAVAVVKADLYADFVAWTVEHGKTYQNAYDHATRFQNYKDNAALAAHLNRQGRGVFGLGPFADLSQAEFETTYLRPIPLAARPGPETRNFLPLSKGLSYPDTKNWVDEGAVNPIKDQGSCGSCWAFSAVGNMEGVVKVQGKVALPDFSEQLFVDCEHDCMIFPGTTQKSCDAGCNGGLMPNAFTYAIREGIVPQSEYPYTARAGACKNPLKRDKPFTAWKWIGEPMPKGASEEAMVAALNELGPLAIAVDATHWSGYRSGIYDSSCSDTRMNHAVLLVGYGTDGKSPYWIIRNSWGTGWGEKGYMRLIRGKNKCGVNMFVCTLVV